jgi:hypothetical protein
MAVVLTQAAEETSLKTPLALLSTRVLRPILALFHPAQGWEPVKPRPGVRIREAGRPNRLPGPVRPDESN